MTNAESPPLDTYVNTFGQIVLAGPLRVPLNQRPWEWQSKNLDDLFDDLVDTADRWCHQGTDGQWSSRASTADLLPHFFGPLVLEEDDSHEARAVVDGQQRLTAAAILVAVMRDRVAELISGPQSVRAAARALHVAMSAWLLADPQSGDQRTRLELDDTVATFFENYVVQSSGVDEREAYLSEHAGDPVGDADDVRTALISATRRLSERLDLHLSNLYPDADPTKIISRLQALLTTLQDAFIVIVVRVLKSGMAPQVFAGLNTRGTALNEADKIKNELFLVSPERDHLQIKESWDSMVRLAPDRDPEGLLRFQHIAFVDDTRQSDLYNNVRRKELSGANALSVVRRWADDAKLLRITAAYEDHPNISPATRQHLLDIRLLRHSYVRPLLLRAARNYLLDSQDIFAQIVFLARNIAFRALTVGRTQPETFLNRIGRITRQLGSELNLDDLQAELLKISPDEDFQRRFALYHEARTAVQYYILYELEIVAGGNAGLVPAPHSARTQDHANNLEHVLPKTPSLKRTSEYAAWRDPSDPRGRRKNLVLHRQYLHRIGNLLLIESDINSELSDFDFPAKQTGIYPDPYGSIDGRPRKSYGDSQLRLPGLISNTADWPSWEPSDIDRRQEELAKYALEAWQLQLPPARRTRRRASQQ